MDHRCSRGISGRRWFFTAKSEAVRAWPSSSLSGTTSAATAGSPLTGRAAQKRAWAIGSPDSLSDLALEPSLCLAYPTLYASTSPAVTWGGFQRGQILRHELSRPEVRLLLGLLVLEDARRDHDPVPGVNEVVRDEARHLADDRDKVLIHKLGHLLGIAHALVASHCNVHSFYLPPSYRKQD